MKASEARFRMRGFRMRIPRKILVKDAVYEVKFVRQLPEVKDRFKGTTIGVTCPDTQTILLKQGLSKEDRVRIFFHELLHAIEFEYGVPIAHKLIYRLEGPLAQVIVDNLAG
jgi:hypothetical protein